MYSLFRELIDLTEVFEQEHPRGSLLQFASWLNNRLGNAVLQEPEASYAELPPESLEPQIGRLVGILGRYARVYLKKAVEGSPLSTPDDFSYLGHLMAEGPMSKTRLIEENVHEKTTGMEIIKRLTNAGLIEQSENPDDKRSKLLHITPAGREVMLAIIGKLQVVSHIVTGDLSTREKWQLLYLLDKLDRFHRPIFLEERDKSLEELLRKISPTRSAS